MPERNRVGGGITENIRKMHKAANDATSVPNDATSVPNDATSDSYDATSPLEKNKRAIDEIISAKIKLRMKPDDMRDCIIEACIVEHTIEELAKLLNKSESHIRNHFITNMVADGILLPTKPRHSPGQTYITNPKYKNSK